MEKRIVYGYTSEKGEEGEKRSVYNKEGNI